MGGRAPFRFQSAMCAFAFWDCILLANDCQNDGRAYITLVRRSLQAHMVVAGLLCLMLVQEEDLPLPLLRYIPKLVQPLRRFVARRCALLASPRLLTCLSLYYCSATWTRFQTSTTPDLWLIVFLLKLSVHILNMCSCCCGSCAGKQKES
mmetsp:Transcript_13873/g.32529  ORF Transcript_13873/g.32529 Transcript_13873/m.32529 type:complete len:150 (-) Transcript_13873:82-531(-)